MNFITFLLLVLLFPYWFPAVAGFFLVIGGLWVICYPIACTVHLLYMRVRYGRWVHWHILYPGH